MRSFCLLRGFAMPIGRVVLSAQDGVGFARPMKTADAIRAVQITSRFPSVHGAPVHLGDPSLIGIRDLSQPDYGDAVDIMPDEIPVFWACGVTPQSVIASVRPEFAITHAPGCMLVTDLLNEDLVTS